MSWSFMKKELDRMPEIRLANMPLPVLQALTCGELGDASLQMQIELPLWFLDEKWLWNIRIAQLLEDPASARWLVYSIQLLSVGVVVGHAGFHGPPDGNGMVEIGYSIAPAFRNQGFGRATAVKLIEIAVSDPVVKNIRASISPTNEASLRLIAPLGFSQIGEQWDEEDGLELVFERPAR